jgi:hypothetical protein
MSRRKKKKQEEPEYFYIVYRKILFGHITAEYLLDDDKKVRKFETRRAVLKLMNCETETELNAKGMYISEEKR